MGLYVTHTAVREMMNQFLGQVTASAEYSNTTVLINRAISRAEGKVNGYVAQKYSLPFTAGSVPPLVIDEALALSTYYTYKYIYPSDNMNRNEFVDQTDDNTENNVFAQLKEIAEGKLLLTLTDGSLLDFKESSKRIRASHANFNPIFNIDSATAWSANSTLLDEIKSERT